MRRKHFVSIKCKIAANGLEHSAVSQKVNQQGTWDGLSKWEKYNILRNCKYFLNFSKMRWSFRLSFLRIDILLREMIHAQLIRVYSTAVYKSYSNWNICALCIWLIVFKTYPRINPLIPLYYCTVLINVIQKRKHKKINGELQKPPNRKDFSFYLCDTLRWGDQFSQHSTVMRIRAIWFQYHSYICIWK